MRIGDLPPLDMEPLAIDERVKFYNGDDHLWWTVMACNEFFAVCTAAAPFKKKGTRMYTIVDYRNGVRGACNLIGWGYGDGNFDQAECAKMLGELMLDPMDHRHIEVSHRNRVPLDLQIRHGVTVSYKRKEN